MIEGIYNNAASLTTLEKWQASITQNLVASKVAGFKKSNFAIESDDRVKTSYNPEQSAAQHTGGLPVRTTRVSFRSKVLMEITFTHGMGSSNSTMKTRSSPGMVCRSWVMAVRSRLILSRVR